MMKERDRADYEMNGEELYEIPPMIPEGIISSPWEGTDDPSTICLFRLHAFGDCVITLPILAGLRERFPETEITMITSTEYVPFFSSCRWVDQVYGIDTRASKSGQIADLSRLIPRLYRPEVVIDLQNSRLSSLLRQALRPQAWSSFDRFAPKLALDRYSEGVRAALGEGITPVYTSPLPQMEVDRLLADFSLPNDTTPLFCLNPAGCWGTKNWSPMRYAELGQRLIEAYGGHVLLLGTENVRTNARVIREVLGPERCIDLVDRTSLQQLMAIMQKIDLVVSDDSGLMHLAWTTGRPTVGLFGASRTTWSGPAGEKSRMIGSEDLECGACMSPVCSRGDLFCLERITVDQVLHLCASIVEHAPRSTED